MRTRVVNLIGWIGMIAILLAYGLMNFGLLTFQSPVYIVLNLFGSISIFLIAMRHKDYQPAILNAVWALIAFIAIVRLFV